jgi:hypothetical protein
LIRYNRKVGKLFRTGETDVAETGKREKRRGNREKRGLRGDGLRWGRGLLCRQNAAPMITFYSKEGLGLREGIGKFWINYLWFHAAW